MLEDGQSTICHTLASSHYMLTKRGCAQEGSFLKRRADETLIGDLVLICNEVNDGPACFGEITAKECFTVSQGELIQVWTESMHIVVDKIVSTCYTDDWDPIAVEAFRCLVKT